VAVKGPSDRQHAAFEYAALEICRRIELFTSLSFEKLDYLRL
jgi:hypothetical protein